MMREKEMGKGKKGERKAQVPPTYTVQHYRIYLSPGADGICSCNFTWCHHVGLVSRGVHKTDMTPS